MARARLPRRSALAVAVLASAAMPAAMPAALPAQLLPAQLLPATDGVRMTELPPLRAGTLVRVYVRDSTLRLDRARAVGPTGLVQGRLVTIDTAAAVVELAHDYTFTFPRSSVRRFEQRVGAGRCWASETARVTCRVLGALGGAVGGVVVGGTMGRSASQLDAAQRRFQEWGAVVGSVIGLAVIQSAARHRWVAVPAWASEDEDS